MSVSVWADEITPEVAMQHVAALAAMPEWGAGGRILTDLTGVSSLSRPEPEQISELAHQFEEQLSGRTRRARWAVIANVTFNEAAQFGRQIRKDVRDLIVFFDLASACIWLGVDTTEIRPVLAALRREALSATSSTDIDEPRQGHE